MSPIQVLRDECMSTLSNYTHQAQKTCALLTEREVNSLSLDRLLAIIAQTQAEDEIQKSYIALRLFSLLIGSAIDCESSRSIER
jgi:hypothetical protein